MGYSLGSFRVIRPKRVLIFGVKVSVCLSQFDCGVVSYKGIDDIQYNDIRYRTRENLRKVLGTREGKEREGEAEKLGEVRRDAGVPLSGELPTRIRTEDTRGFVLSRVIRGRVRVRVVQEPKPKTRNPIFTPVHFKRLELLEAIRHRIDSRKSLEERLASERLTSETPYNAQDRPSRFDPPLL